MASILKTDKIEGVTSSGTVQMPAGHVVQMQSTTTTTAISTTSTSYVASGLIVSITPKFSTSKIIVNLTGGNLNWSGGVNRIHIELYRQLTGGSYTTLGRIGVLNQGSDAYGYQHSGEIIDSPSTANAINYQAYYKTSTQTVYFNSATTNLTIRAMEIAQ